MIRYYYEGPILRGEVHVVKLDGEFNGHGYFIAKDHKVRSIPPHEVFETPEAAMAHAKAEILRDFKYAQQLQEIRAEHLKKWPTYRVKVV